MTDVALPRPFLDGLVNGVSIRVTDVPPAQGQAASELCSLRLDALDIEQHAPTFDAAIIGLADQVQMALDTGILEQCSPEQAHAVLRLHLASLDRTLTRLLTRASMYRGADYVEDW